jgi:hypothetical protein
MYLSDKVFGLACVCEVVFLKKVPHEGQKNRTFMPSSVHAEVQPSLFFGLRSYSGWVHVSEGQSFWLGLCARGVFLP